MRTENKHGIRKGAEDWKEQTADNTRAKNVQQELAAMGQIGGGEEHEVAIDDDEEDISNNGGGARQEPVGLVASGIGREGRGPVESEVGRIAELLDPIGD